MNTKERKRNREARARWRAANPEKHQLACARQNRRRRLRRQAWLWKFKDRPCADCGGRFHLASMQFDYVHGKKLFTISSVYHTKSLKMIEGEMAKCEVVCANCHAVRTYNRRNP